ncbi:hypothetical protein AAG570_012159 [Ranatra chinensis]|uniref:Iroquois-class homeodomain protein domain-containing protein n=1 Tax=Ranatra chinensis TaxID=642074 RepID=A0ABD0Z091_9HEMI
MDMGQGHVLGAHHGYHHQHHLLLKEEAKDCGIPIPATKPKIWSLADTAACKTPPPPPPQHQGQAGRRPTPGTGASSGAERAARGQPSPRCRQTRPLRPRPT